MFECCFNNNWGNDFCSFRVGGSSFSRVPLCGTASAAQRNPLPQGVLPSPRREGRASWGWRSPAAPAPPLPSRLGTFQLDGFSFLNVHSLLI